MVSTYALRPAWTPLTIVLMVIGFIVAWPLGLVMLAYILWGDKIPEIRRHFGEMSKSDWNCGPRSERRSTFGDSGNFAFDDYRAAEMKRLDEERKRLDEERKEFENYVRDLRRARDKEEFDRFMSERASRPRRTGGGEIDL